VKFYPLSVIDNPPETVFIDVKDKDFDSTIKYDASFFALLDRVVQTEPWLARDRASRSASTISSTSRIRTTRTRSSRVSIARAAPRTLPTSSRNADGSIDIRFGPKAPEGKGKESNWIPTDPNRRFELMFRLYGPTKALFDKAWTLPNVEKIN
jgi:hypothetical protein